MKQKFSKTKERLKIVLPTIVTIFGLLSAFTATMAWFASQNSVDATGMQIMAKSMGGLNIDRIRLLKFDYAKIALSQDVIIDDYFNLDEGAVNSYDFNKEENSFGKYQQVEANTGNYSLVDGEYVKGADNSGDYIWQTVDVMNIYDPYEKVIKGSSFDLSSLYCNTVYEVTFNAPTEDYLLNLTSEILSNRSKQNDQIYLSSCCDIDVFYEDDLTIDAESYSSSKTYALNALIVHDGVVYQANTAINAAESYTSSHWTAVAEYSSETTYAVGKAVIYNDSIYTCTTAINAAENFVSNKWALASTYSSSSTYALDDVVIHNGNVYACKTAIQSGETFTGSHWKPVAFNNVYSPSYKPNLTTDDEGIFYKTSYLSSRVSEHKHFYASNGHSAQTIIDLNDGQTFTVNQSNEKFKVYININYAPSQLESYYSQIKSPNDIIKAVYDFIFYFQFEGENS